MRREPRFTILQSLIAIVTKVFSAILERFNSLSAVRLAWVLAIVAMLVYADTAFNGYVLDDLAAVTDNAYVTKGVKAIPDLLRTPYHKGYQQARNTKDMDDLYRPLSLVTLAVEYQFFERNATVSHVVNVLLFAGCAALLFLLLRRLFGPAMTSVAFIAALLFAVHPIHTEVVANIKSRDELLCFLFAMLSLLCYARYATTGRVAALLSGASCLFLSLLSKETSISFMLVIPLIFFRYINEDKRRGAVITLLSLVACGAFIAIRFAVIDAFKGTSANLEFMDNQLVGAPSLAIRIATAIYMLGYYIRLLVVPYPLVCDYSYNTIPFVGPGDIWVLLSAAVYIALGVYGIYRLLRYRKDPWAFGILFFLITIALFSNIVFLLGATMAERFVFFSSAGFCLVVALGLWEWGRRRDGSHRSYAIMTGTLVCVAFSAIAIVRNTDWKDNLTLFNADVITAPRDARLWNYLGYETKVQAERSAADAFRRKSLYEESIVYFDSSIAIYPKYRNARKDLAGVFVRLQRYDLAEEQYKAVLALSGKDSSTAISDLGYIYFLSHKYPESIGMCYRALLIDPKNITTYFNLSICYMQVGKFDSAIYAARQGLLFDSGNTNLKANIAAAYQALRHADSLSNGRR